MIAPFDMNFFQQSNLKDQLFCMREERDFFQSKYTEQVKEIEALKKQLESASNEILRLREQVMQRSENDLNFAEEKKSGSFEAEENQDQDEEEAIRRKASSLLQWAEFRENSPCKSPSVCGRNDDYEDEDDHENDSLTEDEDENDHELIALRVMSTLTADSGDQI